MDNLQETTKIEIEQDTLKDLDTTRKWTMFLAILGFIIIGVLLITGIFTGIFLSVFNKGDTASSYPGWFSFVMIIAAAVLYFFPVLYLFRFSKHISDAVKSFDKQELNKAFRNLRFYFVYTGILVIAVIVIYVVAFLVLGASVTFLKS